MTLKITGIIGLLLLIISRLLLMQGDAFIQSQAPFDFAHLFMLVGSLLCLAFCFVFPKSIFNSIAVPLIVLGVIAHCGMCALDFTLWSFGADEEGRNALVGHLMTSPKLWYPYFVIGPAFLYAGLTTQSWYFILRRTIASIIALSGGFAIGLGQMIWQNQLIVLAGTIALTIGFTWLLWPLNKIQEEAMQG